jgi:hypothetical protein
MTLFFHTWAGDGGGACSVPSGFQVTDVNPQLCPLVVSSNSHCRSLQSAASPCEAAAPCEAAPVPGPCVRPQLPAGLPPFLDWGPVGGGGGGGAGLDRGGGV